MVVIDSIQTMFSEDVGSAPGSVSQVRETTAVLLRLAKELSVTFFIVGHQGESVLYGVESGLSAVGDLMFDIEVIVLTELSQVVLLCFR